MSVGTPGEPSSFVLAIHGGAGALLPALRTEAGERAYRSALSRALRAGHAALAEGGAALEAVTAAVCCLEDDPLFNAGHGSVFTSTGRQEMDAAIMDGRTRAAGAVAGICGPRNPIRVARAVMDDTPHVLLTGAGAEGLARRRGLPFEAPDYFATEARRRGLEEALSVMDGGAKTRPDASHGTVGAVALDRHGNLAAATSTGGLVAKLPGRVGDSPILGAGTFADNDSCAISCTGQGEVFLRWMAAHEVSARMRYLGESLVQASEYVVLQLLPPHGGTGGLIGIDRSGNVVMPFNCARMYRGQIAADGIARTAITPGSSMPG